MDAVYPAGASALARGRRRRRPAPRLRHRTAPVTFAEIKEVDEEEEAEGSGSAASLAAAAELRRRPDLLGERLDREFAAFRRRRLRRQPLREPDDCAESPPRQEDGGRAASEPRSDPSAEPSLRREGAADTCV